MSGVVALVGGGEWRDGCTFDRSLLDAAGTGDVLVLPTAAAYEHPERAVQAAADWFAGLGAKATGLDVLRRPDADDDANAEAVRAARFIYLAGGSPLHLRSVLKESKVWDALVGAWQDGAVVAGSSAGAMVLTDPMVDPRGGAFTMGLGLIEQLAVIPHFNSWSPEKTHRTIALAAKGLAVVGIPEQTAVIRDAGGAWRAEGVGDVTVFLDGQTASVEALSR
ncbi:MAG TPA: Type 1 glutamine amidotransferase-like domain-containing protein [Acidimicrobiales bacterium]|nr:Type 1 glutamine amidotransferase-like domain-containing protein [Acidimicrobiales bacterium]